VQSTEPAIAEDPEVVALVQRAVGRDSVAFGALYDRYLDQVYRYVFFRVGNRADAEDLSEQAFLKAWSAIERFSWQGKPFLAWLYTICHNLVVDWYRRSGKPVQSLDDPERLLDVASASAAETMMQSLDADLLAAAIKRLTSDQQQVVTLKFIAGFDTDEIARMMGKNEGAVRALQLRALQSLRRDLQRQGDGLWT
jgi:RNA polymerase sigma-70 factor, ECF subfamily